MTKEQRAERRTQTCRHFTGIQNERCAAGILYATVKDTAVKPFKWPCLDANCSVVCDSASYYTREEAEARETEIKAIIQRIGKAREAIVNAADGKRGVRGSIPCPCCEGGKLNYTIAGVNGHIWAACSTEGCVRWME